MRLIVGRMLDRCNGFLIDQMHQQELRPKFTQLMRIFDFSRSRPSQATSFQGRCVRCPSQSLDNPAKVGTDVAKHVPLWTLPATHTVSKNKEVGFQVLQYGTPKWSCRLSNREHNAENMNNLQVMLYQSQLKILSLLFHAKCRI